MNGMRRNGSYIVAKVNASQILNSYLVALYPRATYSNKTIGKENKAKVKAILTT